MAAQLYYGGEDAFFIRDLGEANPLYSSALGVADGVGGWQESGVNPADYSKKLMSTARAYLGGSLEAEPSASASASGFGSASERSDGAEASTTGEGSENGSAVRALAAAHAATRLPGSATACIARLCSEERVLDVANLGDSGLVLIRNGEIIFQTPALQHFFDCPYQMGAYPEYTDVTDSAEDAQVFK